MSKKSYKDEIVQNVKEAAQNLESGFISHDEYVSAMHELISYFQESLRAAEIQE